MKKWNERGANAIVENGMGEKKVNYSTVTIEEIKLNGTVFYLNHD